jgi:hypothetical protein
MRTSLCCCYVRSNTCTCTVPTCKHTVHSTRVAAKARIVIHFFVSRSKMFSSYRVAAAECTSGGRFVIKRCVRLSTTGLVIGKRLMFCGTVPVFWRWRQLQSVRCESIDRRTEYVQGVHFQITNRRTGHVQVYIFRSQTEELCTGCTFTDQKQKNWVCSGCMLSEQKWKNWVYGV